MVKLKQPLWLNTRVLLLVPALLLAHGHPAAIQQTSQGGEGAEGANDSGPSTSSGKPIPQKLYSMCKRGEDIRITGDTWNDQFVRPLHADQVVLLVVDMQPLFYSADSAWGNPLGLDGSAMKDIVPLVRRLARGLTALSGDPTRVALTQFITPEEARDAAGSWRHYYTAEGNRDVTQAAMRKRGLNVTHMLSVMPGLQDLAATGALLNKTTASAFGSGSTRQWLAKRPWVTALVIAGVETDYCVLATALSAVDAGYRVILVEDGIASTQPHSGHATIDYIARRFDSQIELGTADDILQQLRSGCCATVTAK